MIKLSLELTRSEANGPTYRPYTDVVDKVSSESFEAVKAKVEFQGWLIHPWLVSDQHPYDEGYAVAALYVPLKVHCCQRQRLAPRQH
ncbi:hypothetical protein [Pseudomonas sp. S3E12]|uniref:hypothetical protein n=1 Tax=Pseudomonas sp. S3E12 TaxID=1873126 RepID=UPI002114E49F|nr:hypothetical protein [Pseudomonas sp. S3E12]